MAVRVDTGPMYNPLKKRVLDTIAAGESPGYNVLYGGEQFSGYGKHPGVHTPIPGTELKSSAAGRYQFLESTWEGQAERLGLKDFSPSSQDLAAWDLAERTYKTETGRNLLDDVAKDSVEWSALGSQWESLRETPAGAGVASEGATPTGKQSLAFYLNGEGEGQAPAPAAIPLDKILQLFSTKYEFTPVDYDPFEVLEKSIGKVA